MFQNREPLISLPAERILRIFLVEILVEFERSLQISLFLVQSDQVVMLDTLAFRRSPVQWPQTDRFSDGSNGAIEVTSPFQRLP